jgi:lysophospholipid acyltransferase (LPLAT)-like uncharacterized protein
MEKDIAREVYKPASLETYSLKERLLIHLAERAFYALISLVGKTLRFETDAWGNFEQAHQQDKIPIYVFWHNRIFAGTYFFRHRGIVVITSQSFDGEYIARFIQRFGYGVARGSSTRGGVSALVELIRVMRRGRRPAAFSIDGPKGPKYVAKSGACLLAKKTQNPMMPFVVETKNYWEVKSWDRLQIPKPFSRVRVFIGRPIFVSSGATDAEIENKRLELQKALDELVERGKQWREQKN